MTRTLVFPSCNEPGLEVVQALAKSNKIEVVGGSSIDPEFDPSRWILRHHLQCPPLSAPNFRPAFEALLRQHRIEMVFPTTDGLVAEFSRWNVDGVRFVATNAEAANIFLSKSRTYERLSTVVPVPDRFDAGATVFPAYAKPDVGGGGRGHLVLHGPEELRLAVRDGLLMTEYLPGPEFTVDCINDLNGNLLFANVRLRGHIGRGIALGTCSVAHRDIAAHVDAIARAVRIEGPWFAQFKLAADGQPKLTEVNVRVAGSMGLTRLSGVNIPAMAVFLFLGHKVVVPRPMNGIAINRCLKNIGTIDDFSWVVWDLEDTLLRKDRRPDPDLVAVLYDLANRGKRQLLLSLHPDPKGQILEHKLPGLFVEVRSSRDKPGDLAELVTTHGIDLRDCIVINDSNSERLAFEKRFPDLRILSPDAVEVLGREAAG